MFELHASVVRPLLTALDARTIVEVGADQGAHTACLASYATEVGGVLHVVDPVVSEPLGRVLRRSPDAVLHAQPSLDCLVGLPEADVVLIDGDHNHFTVLSELRELATCYGAERLPVILMHDVAWPYARRDMYYAPERLPAEAMHPTSTVGVRPSWETAEPGSPFGFNHGFHNAAHEGGDQNGVLTAAEDFVAETPGLSLVVLEAFHGLAVVYRASIVDEHPAFEELLEHLRDPRVQRLAADLERGRIDHLMAVHDLSFQLAVARDERRDSDDKMDDLKLENAALRRELAAVRERGTLPRRVAAFASLFSRRDPVGAQSDLPAT